MCQGSIVSDVCDGVTGLCECRDGVSGGDCSYCLPGYFNFSTDGCTREAISYIVMGALCEYMCVCVCVCGWGDGEGIAVGPSDQPKVCSIAGLKRECECDFMVSPHSLWVQRECRQ